MERKFNVQDAFFFILLAGLTIIFFKVISPFVISLLIAVILTNIFRRIFVRIKKKTGMEKFSAFITILIIMMVVVVPVLSISLVFSVQITETFQKNWPSIQSNVDKLIDYISAYFDQVDKAVVKARVLSTLNSFAQFFISMIQRAFVNFTNLMLHFIIILYVTYFFLIHGKYLLERIHATFPLKDSDENELFDRLVKISDAMIFGTIVIGLMEGLFGGIIFAIVGIPSAFVWAIIMVVLSMIPIMGTNLILLPTGLFILIQGRMWAGLLILIVGCGGILLSQNIFKPKFVGDRSGLHPVFIVISTMGGLLLFGLVGFLIGPLIAALFVLIWEQFAKRYQSQLNKWNK